MEMFFYDWPKSTHAVHKSSDFKAISDWYKLNVEAKMLYFHPK